MEKMEREICLSKGHLNPLRPSNLALDILSPEEDFLSLDGCLLSAPRAPFVQPHET
jgi:hypothetical protein